MSSVPLCFKGVGVRLSDLSYQRVSAKISGENSSEEIMSGFTRDVVSTPNAPKAIGPYSQAIKANGFIFISGQVAIDPATRNLIEGGMKRKRSRC